MAISINTIVFNTQQTADCQKNSECMFWASYLLKIIEQTHFIFIKTVNTLRSASHHLSVLKTLNSIYIFWPKNYIIHLNMMILSKVFHALLREMQNERMMTNQSMLLLLIIIIDSIEMTYKVFFFHSTFFFASICHFAYTVELRCSN